MASIRKRGSSYLLVVSMGYDYEGNRIRPKQKTVHPPEGLTPKQREKWLKEQAVLFERECRSLPQREADRSITLAKYTELWLQEIAPGKLAKSTLARDRQDIDRFLPVLGHYKLTELRPEHFRNFYADLRKVISLETGRPLSEHTVEGVHATLCTILSDAMEGGFLDHNPAWRTYRYAGRKKEKKIVDPETLKRIISALEEESLKYETYFKLIIATGMRQGNYCAICKGVTSTGRSTSHQFRQLFHAHTVVQSFSNSWRPHDNAVAKSFSATLKQEELYRKDYTSEADFKQCLASCIEYIELYSTQRPHRTLKNRIPCRVEEAFMNSK